MGTAIAVAHGRFGRAALYRLNKPLAPHAHREGHLVVLLEGQSATVAVEGVAHTVDPSQAVAVSPWQPHDFRPSDLSAGALFLTLYITPRWFLDLSRGSAGASLGQMRFGSATIALEGAVGTLVRRVADELASGRADALEHDLTALTRQAFDASWARAPSAPLLVRRAAPDFRVRKALALMNERVGDACALDRIAREAGLSRPHFYKLFRQNLGVTPNMYLNTLRLETSIARLVWSQEPVTSIGLDLGFASQASFTRFFCNNVGIAPSDYRRTSLRF